MSAYPLELVNWDNVEDLMHLADKYDMPVVGAACWDYISRNKESLTLDAPLTSPKNLLRAATLYDQYSSGGNAPGCTCVSWQQQQWRAAAPREVATKLRALVKDEHYTTIISSAVQV
ncbi:hypothetical protein GPECTOR_151g44 [Gonium pectorale]|uniref:Uncharacterized protein n=1 Tax=Gonium pectorale TaxID=33097 RepID=A0A150FXQ9_GONPE|nr:hypothetical protein GPECTOR_151g44 [Gonium pectorale]|eukprot:KXZ42403.1 hypothetical protein GPECTOR_151g44 [Gonium pectorale]